MKYHRVVKSALGLLSLALAPVWVLPAHAITTVTADQTGDINHLTTGASLSAGGSDTWSTPASGELKDSLAISTTSTYQTTTSYAILSVSDLGGSATTALDFIETVDLTVLSVSTDNTLRLGLGALGSNTSSKFGAYSYYASFTFFAPSYNGGGGKLSIITNDGTYGASNNYGSGSTIASGVFSGGTPTINTTYHLTLSGIYDDEGDLVLSFTLSDGTHSTTISTAELAAATVWTGKTFGIQDSLSNSTSTSVTGAVQYSNYDIALSQVPEPSTYAALIFGGVFLTGMLRRRQYWPRQ